MALLLSCSPALASPWAEIGDTQLRSDIELLAASGVIDNATTEWPIPWSGIVQRLRSDRDLDGQPDAVREAARRVLARGLAEAKPDRLQFAITLDATNTPATVRGFDAMGRQDLQSQVILDYVGDTTAVHLALGAKSSNRR
ncbi:MAG: hypothetical protein ISR49_21860, partial [Alphaproteobacteria bacterium]|nr:hypothetical protein [Reyranella sp.]MBL6940484.1 hypothetical protein [Alphaproteobacteria bacterium]